MFKWFKQVREEIQKELAAIALLALAGLFYLALIHAGEGVVQGFFQRVLRGLFGAAAWGVPALTALAGLALFFGRARKSGEATARVAGLGLAQLVAAAWVDRGASGDWQAALAGAGGGVIGHGLNRGLVLAFAEGGRDLVLLAFSAAALLLIVHVPLASLFGKGRPAAGSFFRRLGHAFRRLYFWVTEPVPEAEDSKNGKKPAESKQATLLPGATLSDVAASREESLWEEERDEAVPPASPADVVYPDLLAPKYEVEGNGAHRPPERNGQSRLQEDSKEEQFEQVSLDEQPAYELPPLSLLQKPRSRRRSGREGKLLQQQSRVLEQTLASFGIQARVVDVSRGPAVTRFEIQPAAGVKVSRITSLADDIALNLAVADVRIVAPIPGKAAVGIEVPNAEVAPVYLRDVLETAAFQQSASRLTLALGEDITGRPVVGSLERMLHLLIAGATGSGKSVCINTIICSLLFKARPDEVKLILIDPKMVELTNYNGIPHLLSPVVTDPKKAAGVLRWLTKEMENRYETFADWGVRDITRFNQAAERKGKRPMPFIVAVIDELADLMMVASSEVEDAIQRLAQMARAAGIHLILATQRPSVDVITGVIKANIPSRIAFAVSSQVDSRTILDGAGAEKLLGKGDMLFHPIGASKPIRAQGAFISEQELEALLDHVRRQADPQYNRDVVEAEAAGGRDEAGDEEDDLLPEAARIVVEMGQASVSTLQRRLRVGYTRAGRLIDMLERRGIVGPHQGSKPREVLMTPEMWHRVFGRAAEGGTPPDRRD